MSGKTDIHESSKPKIFKHIELPAKLINDFLQSNKSNINQSRTYDSEVTVFWSFLTLSSESGR